MLDSQKDIDGLEGFEQVERVLSSLAPAGFFIGLGVTSFGAEYCRCTFDETWQSDYRASNTLLRDPVVLWAMGNRGFTKWSDIQTPHSEQFFRNAARFDLKYGVVLADKIGDQAAMLSLAHKKRELSDVDVRTASGLFFGWLDALYGTSKIDQRTKDVLRLLANGRQIREVAQSLQITRDTVNKRLQNARSRLGAETTVQAVAIAVRKNLI